MKFGIGVFLQVVKQGLCSGLLDYDSIPNVGILPHSAIQLRSEVLLKTPIF
jgi:hypothetical protein